MHNYAPARCVVWFRVPIRYLFFIYTRQSVRIIIMRVCIKGPQESCNMGIEFRIPRFPPERHYYMLINKGRICNNAAFLVLPLIEGYCQGPDFLLYNLFELASAVV